MTKNCADFKYFRVEKSTLFFLIFCDKKVCIFEVLQSRSGEIIFLLFFVTKKCADLKYYRVEKVKLYFLIFCDKKVCRFEVFQSRKGEIIFSDFL